MPIADQLIVKIASTFVEDGSRRGRLFVMDEPTAAVSSQEAERLFGVIAELKRRDCAIVYVSHRIDEVLRISDRITVLRDGVNEATIPASGATRALLIERMTGRAAPEASMAEATSCRPAVSFSVHGVAGLGLSDLSFELRDGEILGVAGVGDAGGDRLLKCLFGGARTGEISIAGSAMRIRNPADAWRRGFAYVPGERRSEGLFLSHDIAFNVTLPHLGRLARLRVLLNRPAERAKTLALGRRVRLRSSGPRQNVWRLSGGNQQKAMFARAVAGARGFSCSTSQRAALTSRRSSTSIRSCARSPAPARRSSSHHPTTRSCSAFATGSWCSGRGRSPAPWPPLISLRAGCSPCATARGPIGPRP